MELKWYNKRCDALIDRYVSKNVKKCTCCGEPKHLKLYSKDAKSPDGHKQQCMECLNKKNVERYKNDEEYRELKKWYSQQQRNNEV